MPNPKRSSSTYRGSASATTATTAAAAASIGTLSGLAGGQTGQSALVAPCPRVFRAVVADRGGATRGMKTAVEGEVAEQRARPFRVGAGRVPHAYL
jgi:hypothetical protein